MRMNKSVLKIFLLSAVILVLLIGLCGCTQTETTVESVMKITDDSFLGERIITVNFGGDFIENENKRKNVEDIVKNNCPPIMSSRSELSAEKYGCIFVMSFSSLEDYEMKVASIIGKQISVAYGHTDTALSKGTYYKEDYDCLALMDWLINALRENGYENYISEIHLTSNAVEYNTNILNSEKSVTDSSTVTGEPVHEISVRTKNHKNGTYDRTLSISFPKSTYVKLGTTLQSLLNERIDTASGTTNWTDDGDYTRFSVDYKNISIEQLTTLTEKFLDGKTISLYYGDQNHSSTPFAEQLVFEEKIDVLSFVADNNKAVPLLYTYELPEETTHGEGVELIDGEWQTNGNWLKNSYRLSASRKTYDIRIPDGMQFIVKGINIKLTSLNEDRFRRETESVFDRNTGEKGLDYAYNFLYNAGVNVAKENTFDGAICRITQEGTVNDLSKSLSDIFGSGNYFEYTKYTATPSVVTEISTTDHINITHMLTGANSHININYTVQSESNQYIKKLKITDNVNQTTPVIKSNKDKSQSAAIASGNFTVSYSSTVPYDKGIQQYYTVSIAIVVLFMLIIFFLDMHYKKTSRNSQNHTVSKNNPPKQKSERHSQYHSSPAPSDDDVPYNLDDFL